MKKQITIIPKITDRVLLYGSTYNLSKNRLATKEEVKEHNKQL